MKLVDIDDILWLKFRKKCFNNDITMKDKLAELIKEYVETR